jgi:hypothetical protein
MHLLGDVHGKEAQRQRCTRRPYTHLAQYLTAPQILLHAAACSSRVFNHAPWPPPMCDVGMLRDCEPSSCTLGFTASLSRRLHARLLRRHSTRCRRLLAGTCSCLFGHGGSFRYLRPVHLGCVCFRLCRSGLTELSRLGSRTLLSISLCLHLHHLTACSLPAGAIGHTTATP